jgi:hypothetical protein
MWAPNDNRWLLFFVPFCAFVAGSIIYMNLSNAEEVPKTRQWNRSKSLYVCDAPDYIVKELDRALEFVGPYSSYDKVMVSAYCMDFPEVQAQCSYDGGRIAPCLEGAHLITGADQAFQFGSGSDGGHGDEGLWMADPENNLTRVTTMFPSDLHAIIPDVEDPEEHPVLNLPHDIAFLVLCHALLHAEGYDHVFLDLPGPFVAEPTGHIMQADITKLGTSTTGL